MCPQAPSKMIRSPLPSPQLQRHSRYVYIPINQSIYLRTKTPRYVGTIEINIVSWLCRMCAFQDLPPTLPKQAPEPAKPSDSGKAGVAGRRGSKSTTARRGSGTSAGSFDGGRLLEPISKVSGAKPLMTPIPTKGS